MTDFKVNLTVTEAYKKIESAVIDSITGKLIDAHSFPCGDGIGVVCVYEKHYYRAGNRLTLTATIYPEGNLTHVHLVSAGGGQGLLRFDWGASGSFESCIEGTLEKYMV